MKGHVKPDKFLGLHEKFLIGVATKGGKLGSSNFVGLDCFSLAHIYTHCVWFYGTLMGF